MKKLLGILLIIHCAFAFGQDYSSIYSNGKQYFQFDTLPYANSFWPNHDVLSNDIDSIVIIGSDTILYPIRVLNKDFTSFLPPFCNALYDTSWLGVQVIKKQDSTIFFNSTNESIFIQTPSFVNQSWKLFTYPNQDYVEATVMSFNSMSVLGNTDSAATIQLQLFDSSNLPISSSINGKEIIISKSNGFVKGFNWHLFPHQGTDKPYILTEHNRLTYGDVYDFEINDEFHYRYAPGFIPPAHKIRRVVGKWSSGLDSVTYVYEDLFETQTVDFTQTPPLSTFSTTITIDTVGYGNLSSIIYDVAPAAPIFEDTSSTPLISELYIKNLNYNNRKSEVVKQFVGFYIADSSCYVENSNYYEVEFIAGCGQTSTYLDFSMGNQNIPEKLQYFKKGTETWGMPHILTSLAKNENPNSNSVLLYPNPVRDALNIQTSTSRLFNRYEILDLSGRLTQEGNFNQQVKVPEIDPGIYVLKLIGKNEQALIKFVKQ